MVNVKSPLGWKIRYGQVVKMPGFHPGVPGSIPGIGTIIASN